MKIIVMMLSIILNFEYSNTKINTSNTCIETNESNTKKKSIQYYEMIKYNKSSNTSLKTKF
jgi:hypothetical protein